MPHTFAFIDLHSWGGVEKKPIKMEKREGPFYVQENHTGEFTGASECIDSAETIEILQIISSRNPQITGDYKRTYQMKIKDKYGTERNVNIICDYVGKHIEAIDYVACNYFEFLDWKKRIQDCKVGDKINVSSGRIRASKIIWSALVKDEECNN